jgi:hypothetical protein
MDVARVATAARRARESTPLRAAWLLGALLLLAPSTALAVRGPLVQPPPYQWLAATLYHLGIGGLYLFAAMYLLAGYADYLLLGDAPTDRYGDATRLAYALTHRTGALAGSCLLVAGGLCVGGLAGIALAPLAVYAVLWAVLFGLVVGLPLHPIDDALGDLDPPE